MYIVAEKAGSTRQFSAERSTASTWCLWTTCSRCSAVFYQVWCSQCIAEHCASNNFFM